MTPGTPTWCDDAQQLNERELGLLLEAAAQVLTESAEDDPSVTEVIDYPPSMLQTELRRILAESGIIADEPVATQLVTDTEADRALSVALIQSLCTIPELRDAVDEAYEARRRIMVIDPATIAAVSLLLLVMKVRRVHVGREGIDVRLDPIRDGALSFITKLFNL
ncbi:MAG: hypothetical protein JO320_09040 [Alphaproteobacteria bacterium]|nr:hypothetical protein [Alphaproteobacteria bacterium]